MILEVTVGKKSAPAQARRALDGSLFMLMRRLDPAACSLPLAGEPLMLGICVMISPFYTSLCLYKISLVLKSLNGTRSVSCWATRNIIWTAANCINAVNALAEIFCAGMPTPFHCNMALSSLKFILENHTIELKWHVAKKNNNNKMKSCLK